MFDSRAISPSAKIQYIYQLSVEIKWIDFLPDKGWGGYVERRGVKVCITDHLFNFELITLKFKRKQFYSLKLLSIF